MAIYNSVSQERKDELLKLIEEGISVSRSLDATGMSFGTLNSWRRRNSPQDKIFFERYERALEIKGQFRATEVEDKMYQNALEGDVRAGMYILNNRIPHRWKSITHQKTEATITTEGSDNGVDGDTLRDRIRNTESGIKDTQKTIRQTVKTIKTLEGGR